MKEQIYNFGSLIILTKYKRSKTNQSSDKRQRTVQHTWKKAVGYTRTKILFIKPCRVKLQQNIK